MDRETKSGPSIDLGRYFLKGPIPCVWMMTAIRLQGRTWQVATLLWLMANLNKSQTFRLEHKWFRVARIRRQTMYAALTRLEAAGLISVKKTPGRSHRITIVE